MTVDILDVRPTPESGVGLYASRDRAFVSPFAFEPRTPDRQRLQCRWRPDRDGRVVCVWESALERSGSLVRCSALALTHSSSTALRSDLLNGE